MHYRRPILSVKKAAIKSNTPAKTIAFLGSLPKKFFKIYPNVVVCINIGMTIIILIIPIYTPYLDLGISETTIRYGMPIILAHPMPKPVMAANNKYLLVIYGKAKNPIPAKIRHIK
jgi:hypothetical protein